MRPKLSKDKRVRKTRFHGWKQHELRILHSNYYILTNVELSLLLKKSRSAIRSMARKLRLRKPCLTLTFEHLYKLHGKSGVYGLVNTTNKRVYIGSSSNIGKRLSAHLSGLANGKHFNKDLQRDWGDGFEIVVFQYCKESELLKHEHVLINMIQNKYNKNPAFSHIPEQVLDKFGELLEQGKHDECWNWKSHNNSGYGNILYNKKYYSSHRVSYAYFNRGDENLINSIVRHTCGNKKCYNPRHLTLGSCRDNVLDYYKGYDDTARYIMYEHLNEIVKMRLDNHTYEEIGKTFGGSKDTVINLLAKFKPEILTVQVQCSMNNGAVACTFRHKGKQLTVKQLLELPECVVKEYVLRKRLSEENVSVENAVSEPSRRRELGTKIEAFGTCKRLVDWVKDERCKCSSETLRVRMLKQEMTNEQAISTPAKQSRKLTYEQYVEICRSKKSIKKLSSEYGISDSQIRNIIKKWSFQFC